MDARLLPPWDFLGKSTGVGCHFLLQCMKVKMKSFSRVWLCDPMDCSPPGSSIHGIFQARVLEWVDIAFSIIYFNWRLINLQYCYGFCHKLTWISHGCTCVPHPELSSHLPSYPIPQGHPSAAALSTLYHASNLDWRSISHMIIYVFQCYSLKSSHPHLLPQSQKTVLYICVSFVVLLIGSSLPSF